MDWIGIEMSFDSKHDDLINIIIIIIIVIITIIITSIRLNYYFWLKKKINWSKLLDRLWKDRTKQKKKIISFLFLILTGQHIGVGTIGDSEQMWWYFGTTFTSIHLHHTIGVDRETFVWIDYDTKQSRIGLE